MLRKNNQKERDGRKMLSTQKKTPSVAKSSAGPSVNTVALAVRVCGNIRVTKIAECHSCGKELFAPQSRIPVPKRSQLARAPARASRNSFPPKMRMAAAIQSELVDPVGLC